MSSQFQVIDDITGYQKFGSSIKATCFEI